ncbi:MFS general substrate transporter [Hypoxylon sp. EC38]|nr:MFS general substrate transporter [Hypoxylon sp. EC38]
MPLNFPAWDKWMWVGLLSIITLLTPFASSILSPAISRLDEEFGNDDTIVGSMTVSIYLLGYVVGPVFIAPLSETYGRKPVLSAANTFFCLWQIGCALAPNIETLVVSRFFNGVGGAGCLTLGGSIIGDLFRPHRRGFAMGIWNIGPLIGPTIGPLLGGFLADSIGWRFEFWIVLAASTATTILIEILNKETSHKVLIQQKTIRLRKELNRDDLKSCYDDSNDGTNNKILLTSLLRPLKMLVMCPLVFFFSLYIAFVFGVVYLLYTTIPTVFEETYGFDVKFTGLVYLSLGLGNVLGWLVCTFFSDKTVVKLAQSNGGVFEPEMRLTISISFGIFLPITLFWYGWSTFYVTHWASPVFSLIPYGFGIMGLFLPITTYLIDSYPTYAASAIAANIILRSVVRALLPLAGPPMYESLGLGWGNSLLGFICVAMIPFPIIIYKFGSRLRKAQRFQS